MHGALLLPGGSREASAGVLSPAGLSASRPPPLGKGLGSPLVGKGGEGSRNWGFSRGDCGATLHVGQLRSAGGSAARGALAYGVGRWKPSSKPVLRVRVAAEPEDGAGDGAAVRLGKLPGSFAGC